MAHPPEPAAVARALAAQRHQQQPWAASAAEAARPSSPTDRTAAAGAGPVPPHQLLAQRARQAGVQPGAPPCEVVADPWRLGKFFVAGGLAGVISRTATAPIDRLKMLLQVEESVQPLTLREAWGRMQAEGSLRAFFRGNGTNALKIAPETAIKLALNDHLKHALGSSQRRRREEAEQRRGGEGGAAGGAEGGERGAAAAQAAAARAAGQAAAAEAAAGAGPPRRQAAAAAAASAASPTSCDPGPAGLDRDTAELSKATRVAIGGVSGAVGQGLVYPLDTVRTRLAVCSQQEYTGGGIVRTAARMWRQEGPASLYRGLVPSMCGILPYAGVDIVLFETLKQELLERHGGALPDLAVLGAGMLSSVIAQFVSYPLALVRTRLQAQGSAGRPVKYRGMADVFSRTLRHEGVAGLYKGLLPNLVKLAPAAGISWYVFESTKRLLGVDPRS